MLVPPSRAWKSAFSLHAHRGRILRETRFPDPCDARDFVLAAARKVANLGKMLQKSAFVAFHRNAFARFLPSSTPSEHPIIPVKPTMYANSSNTHAHTENA